MVKISGGKKAMAINKWEDGERQSEKVPLENKFVVIAIQTNN